MNDHQPSLEHLAALARTRASLLAGLLADYQEQEHLSNEKLAALLTCEVSTLARLALCRRPRPAPQFRQDVERIAHYVGANPRQLGELIRQMEARLELQRTSVINSSSLLAARDHDEPTGTPAFEEHESPNGTDVYARREG